MMFSFKTLLVAFSFVTLLSACDEPEEKARVFAEAHVKLQQWIEVHGGEGAKSTCIENDWDMVLDCTVSGGRLAPLTQVKCSDKGCWLR